MTSSDPVPCVDGACCYAFASWVRPTQGDATWWHTGALDGTSSILVRRHDDVAWVAPFNAAAPPGFISEFIAAHDGALASVTSCSTHDLFSSVP